MSPTEGDHGDELASEEGTRQWARLAGRVGWLAEPPVGRAAPSEQQAARCKRCREVFASTHTRKPWQLGALTDRLYEFRLGQVSVCDAPRGACRSTDPMAKLAARSATPAKQSTRC